MKKTHLKLCLLTHFESVPPTSYLDFIQQAVLGGVTSIQLRYKNISTPEILPFAKNLLTLLRELKTPLIINDNLDLAMQIDAEGLHLGQTDGSPENARACLGPDKILGWSVESWDEVLQSNVLPALDYIAASAIFPTQSKLNCKTYWGLEGLKQITQIARHPVVAIGGIHQGNVRQVMQSGASGIAVISAIHQHQDTCSAAGNLISAMH